MPWEGVWSSRGIKRVYHTTTSRTRSTSKRMVVACVIERDTCLVEHQAWKVPPSHHGVCTYLPSRAHTQTTHRHTQTQLYDTHRHRCTDETCTYTRSRPPSSLFRIDTLKRSFWHLRCGGRQCERRLRFNNTKPALAHLLQPRVNALGSAWMTRTHAGVGVGIGVGVGVSGGRWRGES